ERDKPAGHAGVARRDSAARVGIPDRADVLADETACVEESDVHPADGAGRGGAADRAGILTNEPTEQRRILAPQAGRAGDVRSRARLPDVAIIDADEAARDTAAADAHGRLIALPRALGG